LIFTAFADTAEYLYENLYRYCRSLGLNTAVVTGSTQGKTSIEGFPGDFNTILTCFSPASKGRDAIYTSGIASTATIDVLIGTDCISEGQNLQDCDLCVNYDIHWNPIRIIQRYGRVDRIGSQNRYIQLVNFWPDASLDKYIDLKRRVESRMIAGFIVNPAEAKVLADENEVELAYRRSQLQKLKNETVDIEDISENISITDLGLNEFRLDLLNFEKVRGTLPKPQKGIYAVTYADRDYESGVVFVLRNITAKSKVKSQNRMHPYYLVYISTSGKVIYNHLQPKDVLLVLKMFGKQREVNHKATAVFNHETQDGRNMAKYARLLEQSIESMLEVKKEADIQSLFRKGGTTFNTKIDGMDDFEIICYLILK
jgi:superfamily II DNA/RNA helicase